MIGTPLRRPRLTLKRKQAVWAYAFLLIPMIFFIWIRIYPVFSALNISVRKWDILSRVTPYVGLANYKKLLTDKNFVKVSVNTLKYVLICVPSGLVLSLAVALMLNRIRRGVGFFRVLYFIPYITSIVAVAWIWRWLFMKSGGLINNMLGALGLPQQPFMNSTSQALGVVASNVIWQALGFKIIIFLAGLKQIPTVYYEAADMDGAGPWQTFSRITLPLLNPTVVYLSVMTMIQTLQIFTQIKNISFQGTGGPLNSTNSIVLYIYQTAFQSFNMGYASAMTIVLFLCILLISLVQMKVLNRRVDY